MKLLQFKYWHLENRKMYHVYGMMGKEVYITDLKHHTFKVKLNEGVLLQAIGRTDKFGIDLYEGDIVRQYDDDNKEFIIKKIEHIFMMEHSEESYLTHIPFKGKGHIEKIGNVFEDSYLLPKEIPIMTLEEPIKEI